MKEHYQLLREAAEEIRWLQRRNELLGAKLEGVEMMAMAVASENHRGPGMQMKECVASKIDRYLSETKESAPVSPGERLR